MPGTDVNWCLRVSRSMSSSFLAPSPVMISTCAVGPLGSLVYWHNVCVPAAPASTAAFSFTPASVVASACVSSLHGSITGGSDATSLAVALAGATETAGADAGALAVAVTVVVTVTVAVAVLVDPPHAETATATPTRATTGVTFRHMRAVLLSSLLSCVTQRDVGHDLRPVQQRSARTKGVLVLRAGQQVFEDWYRRSRQLDADASATSQVERCALTSGERGAERRSVRHAEVDDHAGERSCTKLGDPDTYLELHLDAEHDAARTKCDAGDAVDDALLHGERWRLEILAVVTDRSRQSPDAGGNQGRVVASDGGLDAEGEFDLDIHR